MKAIKLFDHFQTRSALAEFLAGRLGAPECWPSDCKVKPSLIHLRRSKEMTLSSHWLAVSRQQTDRGNAPLSINQQTTPI
jgi:hypothetical protein